MAHTSPDATSHNAPNAKLKSTINATSLDSSNSTSKNASNATSHNTSSVVPKTVPNATSATTPIGRWGPYTMLDELRGKKWVGTIPLSEERYQKVAALKDDEAMMRYVRRELHTLGLDSLSKSELSGFVPYFSGTKATRSRKELLEELRTKGWVGELPLSEESYKKVAKLKDDEAMLRYVRRELDALGRRAESEGALRGWVSYFSGTKATRSRAVMLDELRNVGWVTSNAKSGSYAEQKARQMTQ